MSYSDVEHYATMVSGCESLAYGNVNSANAHYAMTVLQLHANDAGLVAGQEGFLDHVKKGAKKAKEWVIALVQAVRAWLKDKYKFAVEKAMKYLMGGPEGMVRHAAITKIAGKLEALDKAYATLESSEDLKDANLSTSFSGPRGIIDKLLKSLTTEFSTKTFFADLDKLSNQTAAKINDFTDTAERLAKAIPTDPSASDYDEKSKRAMGMSTPINVLTGPMESLGRAIIELSKTAKEQGALKDEKKDDE